MLLLFHLLNFCSDTFILFSNFPVIYSIHKIVFILTHFSILPLYIISMWLSLAYSFWVWVLWQCVTNPCFAVADFRVGPKQPFSHDRSSSLSKPSEYGMPGVTVRTDQVQRDSRGRRYEQSKISTVLLTRLPYSLHNLQKKWKVLYSILYYFDQILTTRIKKRKWILR